MKECDLMDFCENITQLLNCNWIGFFEMNLNCFYLKYVNSHTAIAYEFEFLVCLVFKEV